MGKPTSKCSTCGLPRNRPGACDACMLADRLSSCGPRSGLAWNELLGFTGAEARMMTSG